jgi:hypothetical protein
MSVAVLGSVNMDVVLSVPHLPKPGERHCQSNSTHQSNPYRRMILDCKLTPLG